MESDIKARFIEFIGEDEFTKFRNELQVLSTHRPELKFWQEQLLDDFIASIGGNVTAKNELLAELITIQDFVFACPGRGCDSTIHCICKGKDHWHCASCDNEFEEVSELFLAIDSSVQQFPYRKVMYHIYNGFYGPIHCDDIPDDIYDSIHEEGQG